MLTPLPDSGIVDFTHPDAFAWWRDAHQPLFDAGVDVIKSDFGEAVPDDAIAANGDDGRRLHNVYPLLYNRCVYEATARGSPSRDDGPPLVWGRAGWTGSQRYPIQWGGDPTLAAASSLQILIVGLLILLVQRIFRLRLMI